MGENQYTKAKRLGLEKPKLTVKQKNALSWRGRKHSEETKEKISKSRKKFLEENPHMVPYKLNHYSNGRSYAEEYWKAVLDSNDLVYEEQYQIGLYQLDFAFPDKKIDLEIDGEQHFVDQRIVESDKRRNEYLENLGWKIIRIRWSEYQQLDNKKEFVSDIIEQINGSVAE